MTQTKQLYQEENEDEMTNLYKYSVLAKFRDDGVIIHDDQEGQLYFKTAA